MRMFFNSDKAYNFLSRHLLIYTLRECRYRHKKNRYEVEIWRNGWFTGLRGTKVLVECLRDVKDIGTLRNILERYVEYSGFTSVEEWLNEVERLSGKVPLDLWLVVLTEKEPMTIERERERWYLDT